MSQLIESERETPKAKDLWFGQIIANFLTIYCWLGWDPTY